MNKLFSNFKSATKNEWLDKIKIDLKNNTKNLYSNIEGIKIGPAYHADDNYKTHNIDLPPNWEIYQLIDATNPTLANKKALIALNNEVSGLCFSNPNNLKILLKNISIDHIRIDFSNFSDKFPKQWEKFAQNKRREALFMVKQTIICLIIWTQYLVKAQQKNR